MISIVHLVVHLVTLNIVLFERLSKFIIIGNKKKLLGLTDTNDIILMNLMLFIIILCILHLKSSL